MCGCKRFNAVALLTAYASGPVAVVSGSEAVVSSDSDRHASPLPNLAAPGYGTESQVDPKLPWPRDSHSFLCVLCNRSLAGSRESNKNYVLWRFQVVHYVLGPLWLWNTGLCNCKETRSIAIDYFKILWLLFVVADCTCFPPLSVDFFNLFTSHFILARVCEGLVGLK